MLSSKLIPIVIIGLVIMMCVIVWMLFKIWKRVQQSYSNSTQVLVNRSPSHKYQFSSLSDSDKETYFRQIESYVKSQKIYQTKELSLAELAKALNIPKHHLSQVINEKMGCGFIEFLNRYRVEEAIEMLKSKSLEELSLMDVARRVGFNSRSTFYAAFKKQTNQTPGKFRRSINQKNHLELIYKN